MVLFLWGCTAMAQGSFLARPTKIYFDSEPAATQKKVVELRNTSDAPLLLQCSLQDWKRDTLGNKVYSAPGTQGPSCSPYLKLSDENVLLQPGESKDLEILLAAPADSLQHALNTMLMVMQVNEKEADKTKTVSAQFVMQMRIGIHIYFQPRYLEQHDVALERLFFAASGSSSKDDVLANERGLVSEIKNVGQTVVEGKVRLELSNLKSGTTFKIDEKDFNSMPGDRLQIPFTLPANLAKGSYAVTAMVDIGPDAPLKVLEAQIDL